MDLVAPSSEAVSRHATRVEEVLTRGKSLEANGWSCPAEQQVASGSVNSPIEAASGACDLLLDTRLAKALSGDRLIPVPGVSCGGRERLLKLLVCRVVGVRAEGYLLLIVS